jgi:hypothetical protein
MTVQIIESDLLVDLSTDQQQLLSGGQFFPRRPQNNPDIIVTGNLTPSPGDQFPIRILGFRLDQ